MGRFYTKMVAATRTTYLEREGDPDNLVTSTTLVTYKGDDRWKIGQLVSETVCGAVGETDDRFKYTCDCGMECRSGKRDIIIREIRYTDGEDQTIADTE